MSKLNDKISIELLWSLCGMYKCCTENWLSIWSSACIHYDGTSVIVHPYWWAVECGVSFVISMEKWYHKISSVHTMHIVLFTWSIIYGGRHHPDSKVHGANMGPIWGRQDPGGPHVGPMNFVIWAVPFRHVSIGAHRTCSKKESTISWYVMTWKWFLLYCPIVKWIITEMEMTFDDILSPCFVKFVILTNSRQLRVKILSIWQHFSSVHC